jgi:hypothetical protein
VVKAKLQELKEVEDYFPYIGHNLNPEKAFSYKFTKDVLGEIFEEKNLKVIDDTLVFRIDKGRGVFKEIIAHGLKKHQEIASDNNSVNLVVPRHRSLYDYCVGMPLHSKMVNPHVLLLAGHNLFVGYFDRVLRDYGGFVFIRKDTIIKRKGLPKAFITVQRYIDDVFPAYIKQEMFDGRDSDYIKKDLILYPGQEKNPRTGERSGGRTKTGRLRKLNPIFFHKFRKLTAQSPTKLYITPANISFSLYPDAPYIVHPSRHAGLLKALSYIREQTFTFSSFPRYTRREPCAKFEAIANYGQPLLYSSREYKTIRDVIYFSNSIKEKIGLLESIFPATLIFRAMDTDEDISIAELEQRALRFYEKYRKKGINLVKVSDKEGSMMDIAELVERAISTLDISINYHISGVNTRKPLRIKSGRLYCTDQKLKAWYGNNIRHLDE